MALCLLYLLLAALPAISGSRLISAAGADSPSWLLGVFKFAGSSLATGDGAPLSFYLALWVAFLLYVVVFALSDHLPRRATVAVVVVVCVVFALAPPLLSQDIFSYISYSRIWVLDGLNPYVHASSAVPADAAFPYVGWRDATSAYGPLFTLFTAPIAFFGVAGALWAMKTIAAVSLLLILYLVALSSKLVGRDWFKPVLLIGLNPLVLVHVVGGAHNDAMMVMLVMLSVWAVLSRMEFAGGISAVAAFSVKMSAAVAIPFLVLGSKRRLRSIAAMVLSLLLITVASLIVFGTDVLDSFALVGENQARTSFYSLPNQTSRLIGAVGGIDAGQVLSTVKSVYLVAFLAAVVFLLLRVRSGRMSWLTGTGWTYFGLLCATAWLLPWYAIWLLPFAALSEDRRLTAVSFALTAYMLMIRLPL